MSAVPVMMAHPADRVQSPVFDVELDQKAKRACERISENIHIVSNEPSLACYRLQEHIRKSLPQMVEKRYEVYQVHKQLQGKYYDLEYSIGAVNSIKSSKQTFINIQELMKNAMFAKQQLAYKETQQQVQQRSSEKKTPISMYQRFSGSFDLHSSFLTGAGASNSGSLSSSASASGDLRTGNILPTTSRATPSPRRARAASVSSSVTQGTSKSASNTPKHVAKIGTLRELGEKM